MKLSTAQPNAGTLRSGAATDAAPVIASGPFVINLCSSTTPMALSQPESAELKRFSFYVSRRLEDGRERFRLHMGHFQTLAEAEEWLGVVREVYPGAWAGEAPGKRLRERTAATAAAAPTPARVPTPAPAPPVTRQPAPPVMTAAAAQRAAARSMPAQNAPAVRSGAESARAPTPQPAASTKAAAPTVMARQSVPQRNARAVPTLRAAPASQQTPRTQATARAQTTPANAAVATRAATMPSQPRAQAQAPLQKTAPPQRRPQPAANAVRSATAAPTNGKARATHTLSASNVREVLAALDETGATRQMPATQLPPLPQAQPTPQSSNAPPAPRPNLSDSQVLRILEHRRADGSRGEVDTSVALLRPDDTGTRRALHDAVASDSAVSFAVQLDWSVQPIDLRKVPPLAIFSAYTLYSVEGSREGRRWYGLRLGFFSDAISAKQVAHYVRSEFTSVAVVPVSPKERSRASEAEKSAAVKPSGSAVQLKNKLPGGTSEFKLIDDPPAHTLAGQATSQTHTSAPASATAPPAAQGDAPTAAAAAARVPSAEAASPKTQAPGGTGASGSKRSSRSAAGRVVKARDRRSPQTLEETLEILGADQLQIDDGSEATLNDSGVRHLKVEVRKESPFTRLLDRLAERARRER
jgi:hypothetical protein